MWDHVAAIVAVSALLFTAANVIIGVIVKLALSSMKLALGKAIGDARKETDERIESHARQAGELVAAVRQKIHDIETWARDTFVQRESFDKKTDDLRSSIDNSMEKIERRLERMEGKIDNSASKRGSGRPS
jgi:ribosome-associated translation inhibitor RaiA